MGYYISVMIGIRVGGVFSGTPNLEDMKKRINKLQEKNEYSYFNLKYCMSKVLTMSKGDYVVLSGVSNGFSWEGDYKDNDVSSFAKSLSKEFGTEVMAMAWDEQTNKINSGVFLDGKNLNEVNENPINQVLRRII